MSSSVQVIRERVPILFTIVDDFGSLGKQWRILTTIVGGAKIIHQKFIYLIIVTNKIKLNS